MSLKNNIEELKTLVKSENVLLNIEERYCYAQDSTNTRYASKVPDAVVFVESIQDIQRVLAYANREKIPIICRGAGTNMVGACLCTEGGIVLNFSKMNKILAFSPDDMTITVQPGVIVDDIKKLAETKNLYFPPDPSNFKVSTIGGGIAQSSGGAKSFKYGTIKDYILSLTLVLPDGTVMKTGSSTVKDAVGYHIAQLIVGSEGTLAIVAEAELKLVPKPQDSALVVAYFDKIDDAVKSVNTIIHGNVFPSTIDFMDKNSINAVEKFCPSGLKIDKECLLLVEVEGFYSELSLLTEYIQNLLKDSYASDISIITEKNEKENVWVARRASYAAVTRIAPDVVTEDIVVPRSKLPEMVAECRRICNKYNLYSCIVGHVGDGNIHPQIALNLDDDEEFKNYMNAKAEMYNAAVELGGTISAEHGIGIEKIDYIKNTLDSVAIEYMRRIKTTFDPNNILNPGKIFKL